MASHDNGNLNRKRKISTAPISVPSHSHVPYQVNWLTTRHVIIIIKNRMIIVVLSSCSSRSRNGCKTRMMAVDNIIPHCFLLSGSLALEALLIGVHCKNRYAGL